MKDHRATIRVHCRTTADYVSPDRIETGHHLENLSLGGACVRAGRAEAVGTKVLLVIDLGEAPEGAVQIDGEVVWASQEAPFDLGVRFDVMDRDDRERLRAWLQREKAAAP